ncbi:MAG: exosortase/archaeosortase family protein [Candidatus Sulfotelmatobacter sp.]
MPRISSLAYDYIVPNTTRSTFPSSPLLQCFILGSIAVVIWFHPLMSSFALALSDEQYTHILLILPISATLMFLDWKSPESLSRRDRSIAVGLLAIAFVMTAVVRLRVVPLPPDVQLAVNMLAFVVWWIAAFLFCFGSRAVRRSLFALCFLFWMVPLPHFLMNPIVSLLQRGSAASARLLFAAVGIPVAQQGMFVHIPGLTLEVAPECSSIRSSSMLVVTTMVLAHLLLRSFWPKALVVAVAIPLSVAKNGLRIFVLAILGTRVDPSFLTGRLHRQGGVIYFLIALLAILLLVWILSRREEKEQSRPALT